MLAFLFYCLVATTQVYALEDCIFPIDGSGDCELRVPFKVEYLQVVLDPDVAADEVVVSLLPSLTPDNVTIHYSLGDIYVEATDSLTLIFSRISASGATKLASLLMLLCCLFFSTNLSAGLRGRFVLSIVLLSALVPLVYMQQPAQITIYFSDNLMYPGFRITIPNSINLVVSEDFANQWIQIPCEDVGAACDDKIWVIPCVDGEYYNVQASGCQACTGIANCVAGTVTCSTANDQICGTCSPGFGGSGTGSCVPSALCGNGQVDAGELCDGGALCTNCACNTGSYSTGQTSCTACTAIANCMPGSVTCTTATNQICGTCNAGFIGSGTSSCSQTAACGNMVVDAGEDCDSTPGCTQNCRFCSPITNCVPTTVTCTTSTDSICGTCQTGFSGSGTSTCSPNCGNGAIDAPEECDGGDFCTNCVCDIGSFSTNTVNCTECTPITNCTALECTTATDEICLDDCGNSALDPTEQCDGGDGCATCRCSSGWQTQNSVDCASICGDSMVVGNEECDSSADCTNCMCDLGFTSNGAICISNCGNGMVDAGEECDSTNPADHCATGCVCEMGYYSTGLPACTACTAIMDCYTGLPSLECTTAADSTCTYCTPGTWGSQTNTCTDCTPLTGCDVTQSGLGCTDDTDSVCAVCLPGFYGINCVACTPIQNCQTVLCTTDTDQECAQCDTGYTLVGTTMCNVCGDFVVAGTEECDAPDTTTCTNCACNAGFYSTGDQECTGCTPIPNCNSGLTCTSASDQVCANCDPGYAGSGSGACELCGDGSVDGTEQCDGDNSTCTNCNCNQGFYSTGAPDCTACATIPHCAAGTTCTSASDQICPTCDAGYAGSGTGACELCGDGFVDGSEECDGTGNNTCTNCACNDGYFSTGDPECQVCTIILNCVGETTCTTASDQICSQCDPAFTGTGTSVCQSCGDNIAEGTEECDALDTTTCTNCACNPGFYSTGSQECTDCTAIANCDVITCTNNADQVCTTCAAGFSGSGTSMCYTCGDNVVDATEECDAPDTTTCTNCACNPGFYSTGSQECTACTTITNCEAGTTTCTNDKDQVCGTCSPGYLGSGTRVCTGPIS